jgi:hypothetical protein
MHMAGFIKTKKKITEPEEEKQESVKEIELA